ncbi:ABC transporter permease [Halorientalis sp. IM1011]|uniref:ABC transporter permease n=1 Tax=Halorientalis sp. IM1011 TaxID=1932360 RepID=UPI00097CD700|nr:FtsX-like permease family protein [Halorientalis sp. IM1011]AQL44246.1 ABC transporter permease [Halorientalis sp. IM1011]
MNPIRWLAGRFPTLSLARRNLSRATLRSGLAVTAVVIGVVAIGAIGTGGEAFKQDQLEAYEGFGGTATVEPDVTVEDGNITNTELSDGDIDRIRQAAGSATVLPVHEPLGAYVQTQSGTLLFQAQVKGLENPGEFYEARNGTIPDNWRRTIVIGSRVAEQNDLEPGDRLRINVTDEFDRSFEISAVLEPQGFSAPLGADQTVFVPASQFESDGYEQAIVRVDTTTGSVDAATRAIESEFNVREEVVRVEQVQEQREQFTEFFGTINQFLIGVGAISLLVAAVTIANTMLMAAIERESEIGVLRAYGYPRRAVVSLLVAESTILGVIGAAIGVPIALGIGMAINQLLLGDPLAFTAAGLRYVGIGVAFGIVTALLAGLYPAWKAANKRPVEALD